DLASVPPPPLLVFILSPRRPRSPLFPYTTLFRSSVENAFLFKLNVYNGRITTVATAPVEQGGFLVDHERNPRFVYGAMNDGRNEIGKHTSELQSRENLVCRLLLEKKKTG